MSNFLFNCPHCNQQMEAEEGWLGMQTECPHCKQIITIENSEFPQVVGSAVQVESSIRAEKPCPFCGQPIKKEAIICKYCKRDLTGIPSKPQEEETFPYICPECDTFAELPVSMQGKPYECKACAEVHDAVPATERQCPYCHEMIRIRATMCKYCRKPVPPLSTGAAQEPANQDKFSFQKKFKQIFCGTGQPVPPPVAPFAPQPQIYGPILSAPGFWGVTEQTVQNLRLMFFVWFGCACFERLFGLLSMFFDSLVLSRIAGLIQLAILVLLCFLFHQYWKLIPPAEAETTPGKAVGFLFIPFFGLYWFVVTVLRLSAHYEQFERPGDIKVKMIALCYVGVWSASIVFACLIVLLAVFGVDISILQWILLPVGFGSAALGILWMWCMQKCVQNIPRIG